MEFQIIRLIASSSSRLLARKSDVTSLAKRRLSMVSFLQQVKRSDHVITPKLRVQTAEQLRFSSIRPSLKEIPLDETRTSETVQTIHAEQSDHASNTKPLVVIFAWLGAKEKHVKKYSKIWNDRGFETITMYTSPADLMMPKQRAIPRVNKLLEQLYDLTLQGERQDILLHCFSVGGYLFGEMTYQLLDSQYRAQIQKNNTVDPLNALSSVFRGIVFDSLVNLDGFSSGISRTVTQNEQLRKILYQFSNMYLKLTHNFAGIYYERSSLKIHGKPIFNVPTLFFVSDADYVGTPIMSKKVADIWAENELSIKVHNFKDSEHVLHLAAYPEEYENQLDCFLKQLNFKSKLDLK